MGPRPLFGRELREVVLEPEVECVCTRARHGVDGPGRCVRCAGQTGPENVRRAHACTRVPGFACGAC